MDHSVKSVWCMSFKSDVPLLMFCLDAFSMGEWGLHVTHCPWVLPVCAFTSSRVCQVKRIASLFRLCVLWVTKPPDGLSPSSIWSDSFHLFSFGVEICSVSWSYCDVCLLSVFAFFLEVHFFQLALTLGLCLSLEWRGFLVATNRERYLFLKPAC